MPANWETELSGRGSVRLTRWLALLAALTFEVAAGDGERSAGLCVAILASEILLVIAGSLAIRLWGARWLTTTSAERGAILLVTTLAFAVELLVRGLSHSMLPLELLLLSWFRNGVLALSAFAEQPEYRRLCSVLAVFLVVFASALSAQWWLQGFVILFTGVGIWWLMGGYWDSLRGQLAAASSRELPHRWWLLLPLSLLAVLVAIPAVGTQTMALHGFMPSSGGTDWYSAAARSGVGDGDALVAGTDNIRSFAPIEDAPFMTSHEPSLYDLFDDTYDEPVRPQNQDRAISLPPQVAQQPQDHHLAESQQAGKEFSTLRKFGAPREGRIGNRASRALLYVKGRTPLHLKLEVFDRYDGVGWFPEAPQDAGPRLFFESLHGRPWLRAEVSRSLDIYGLPETHALKIIGMDTNRVPSPTQLLGVHIDQLDRTDMFAWAQPGVLRMEREKLPALTAIHVQSRVVDPRRLAASPWLQRSGPEGYRQFGDDDQSRLVLKLAHEWTSGLTPGWPQIEAIVDRMRRDYVLDPAAKPSPASRHTVADFLLERRRGPDYQFAGATVWMLRALGYPARLVSGLYARPERSETRAQQTAVLPEDVHFWVEVYAARDHWIPVEPTPGYELLAPPPTLLARLQSALRRIADWCWRNQITLLAIAGLITALIWQRRPLADAVQTLIWRVRRPRDERVFVRRTLALLATRCRRAGSPCPRGMTQTRWLARLTQAGTSERDLLPFIRLAEWACFAPAETPTPEVPVDDLCQSAVRTWPWRRFQRTPTAPRRPDRDSAPRLPMVELRTPVTNSKVPA